MSGPNQFRAAVESYQAVHAVLALAVSVAACASLGATAASAGIRHSGAVWKVQVIRVNQQPYQPVTFRIAIHASVGDEIFVGFKVWDAQRQSVYSPSLTTYTQPYQATALSLHWSKRGYDGNTVPRDVGYYVEAFAEDYTAHGKIIASPPKFFTLTT